MQAPFSQHKWMQVLLRPAVPLGVMVVLAAASMARKSATYDEAALLASGARYLRTMDNRVNAENPPLLKAFYALPTLVLGWDAPPAPASAFYSYRMHEAIKYGNRALYSQKHPLLILFFCRLMVVGLAVGLGLLLHRLAAGAWSATTAGVLLWIYALSPNILAHARLFTPDLGCTFFVLAVTAALVRLLESDRRRDAVVLGLALGGALLAKYTAVLLVPAIALQTALWFRLEPTRRKSWRRGLGRLIMAGVVALVLVNAAYGFRGMFPRLDTLSVRSPLVRRFQALPGIRAVPLPVPEGYIRGFDIVAYNNRPGFPAVFMGRVYPKGESWWYYYLVAVALKTPLPLLIAWGLGGLAFRRVRRRFASLAAVFAVPPVLVFLNFSLIAFRQLGLRYILPVWPFLILLAGFFIDELWDRATPGVRRVALALGLWYVGESVWIFPDYLGYFNELAGGPAGGWEYLASSNADWGQDLPELARWQRAHGDPDMYVLYYGTAPLEAYGVRSVPWGRLPFPEYAAISVTNYYLCSRIPLVAVLFSECRPIARLGTSIYVFRLGPELAAEFLRRAEEEAASGRPER